MGEGLLSLMKQVSIFIICAQMMMHFKPTAQYGKYIKLLIGVMVLAQLFVPVMSLLGKGGETDFSKSLEDYRTIITGSMEEAGLENIATEERIEEMRLEEIKSILNNYDLSGNEQKEKGEMTSVLLQETDKEVQQEEIYVERIEVKPDD